MLNEDQIIVSNAVLEALTGNDNQNAKIYFLGGSGGTGKTFTYNYIMKEAWGRSFSVLTCAWTGIAATSLDGGRTCHNLFKLPVPINEVSSCNVKPNNKHAEFLRNQDIFIFDEGSVIPNDEALHKNEKILDQQQGIVRTYLSYDCVVADTQEGIDLYPMEFLNSITPNGMPKHRLNLKVGYNVASKLVFKGWFM